MSAVLWLALAACGADPDPGVLPLAGAEKWYREAKEPEAAYEGVLERNPAPGRIGAGRFNAYRLAWIDGAGKPGGRELYVPGKAYLLSDHVGKKVRVVGKAVDTAADGVVYYELWPARLELPDRPAAAVT